MVCGPLGHSVGGPLAIFVQNCSYNAIIIVIIVIVVIVVIVVIIIEIDHR